jgi:copper chaperone NosL
MSCSVNPEPLQFGKDACHTCKMTLMDKKFGAEIVTKKGKIYKFDDMNCMINFHNSGHEPEENLAYRLVIDFANPEKLINAQEAFYIKSENIKSPMASQVAAFSTKEQSDRHKKEWTGILLTWGELITQFK